MKSARQILDSRIFDLDRVLSFRNKTGQLMDISSGLPVDGYPDTLELEYLRDKNAGLPIHVPDNYYPNDDDTQAPLVRWRSCGNLLYSNWLNYFVYQATPYNVMTIPPFEVKPR